MTATRLDLAGWAFELAESQLLQLGRRWRHVQAVGRLASVVAEALPEQRDILVAAAMLHDVGYAPSLAATGFHALDGGRFVRHQGQSEVAGYVAHHSGARNEAELRGLSVELMTEFEWHDDPVASALTYCDLTTGPTGTRVRLHDRIAEIVSRYGHDHPVSVGILAGTSYFERAVDETELRLKEAGVEITGSLAYPD